jgi:pimeloyl-ACP methyl ester carboxylesterase
MAHSRFSGLSVLTVALFCASPATAQQPQMVTIEGKRMRFMTAGLESRKAGQPVVILETGALDPDTMPLDTWKAIFSGIGKIAPVLAYERRGNGFSEADTERPTLRRVGRVLHSLLQEAKIPPPYVLVGHSWGGNYIRAFYDQFPSEVVGMVFIDAATGVGPTRAEKAAVLPPERRAEALAPPVLPQIPASVPPGLRAELEEVGKEMVSDGAESRTLRPITGIPVAIVIATPPGRLKGDGGPIVRLGIQKDLELALAAPNGMLVTANHVGHAVHQRDPELVIGLIHHVLRHAGKPTQ